MDRLWEIDNVRLVNVSFNSAEKDEYEAAMGIDFHRTVANIRAFMERNRRRPLVGSPLVLSRVSSLSGRDAAFAEECRSLFAEFEFGKDYQPHVKTRADWLGAIEGGQSAIPHGLPCHQWHNLSILCTGIVPHCCMDTRAAFAIGDVAGEGLLEIYNKARFRNLRRSLTSRQGAHPCNTCSLQ